jgi:PiT family inorganic phosphate transporter
MGAIAAFVALLGPIGVAIDAVVGTLVVLLIWRLSRRQHVSHHNAVAEVADAVGAVDIKSDPRPIRKVTK